MRGEIAAPFIAQGIAHQQRTQIGAANTDFDTCLNRWPVMPRLSPRRTAPVNASSFWREARTSAYTSSLPANDERSAVCSTDRCSVLLMASPRNMGAMRAGNGFVGSG
jgi:hypothetical protein